MKIEGKLKEYLDVLNNLLKPYDITRDIQSIIGVMHDDIVIICKGECTSLVDNLFWEYYDGVGYNPEYITYKMSKEEFIRCMEGDINMGKEEEIESIEQNISSLSKELCKKQQELSKIKDKEILESCYKSTYGKTSVVYFIPKLKIGRDRFYGVRINLYKSISKFQTIFANTSYYYDYKLKLMDKIPYKLLIKEIDREFAGLMDIELVKTQNGFEVKTGVEDTPKLSI